MDYAKDIQTGKIINADQVTHRSEWLCPVCDQPVIHRRKSTDGRRKPHFAHKIIGEGTIDCENYHPSQEKDGLQKRDGTIDCENAPPRQEKSDTFHLNIVLTTPTLKTPDWHLAIAIALTSIKTGDVTIQEGLTGKVIQPFSAPSIPIPVKIQQPDYQIEISENDSKNIKFLSGLRMKIGNIFTHQGDHGRRLPNQKRMNWGEKYFLVSHNDYQIQCPNEIIQRVLISQQNWECVEIQLPQKPNDAIRDWAQHHLERQIQTPAPTLSLVTPPIYDIDNNVIVIKNTEHVVISVTEPLGNELNARLQIQQKTLTPKIIKIVGKSPVFIDLGRLMPGKTTLCLLNYSSTQLLELDCVSSDEQKTRLLPTPVSLTFQNNWTTPAYSMKIYQELQSRRHNPLVSLKFPTPMRFWIRINSKKDSASQIITNDSDESVADFQKRVEKTIIELIENHQEYLIQLDFGSFGQPLIQQPTIDTNSETRLPKKMRQQIQWIANLTQVDATTNLPARRKEMRLLNNISESQLKKLIQELNRTNRSAIAEPYLRVLAKRTSFK
jgi:hypothetical protein